MSQLMVSSGILVYQMLACQTMQRCRHFLRSLLVLLVRTSEQPLVYTAHSKLDRLITNSVDSLAQ